MTDKTQKLSAEDYQHLLKHGHLPGEPKPSKFHNEKVEWGGETFDSKLEWERYLQLVAMEAEGNIRDLKRQVVIMLQPEFQMNGEKIRPIRYVADFTYLEFGYDCKKWRTVIEDAKGHQTEVFRLKWKLAKWRYRKTDTRFLLSHRGGPGR